MKRLYALLFLCMYQINVSGAEHGPFKPWSVLGRGTNAQEDVQRGSCSFFELNVPKISRLGKKKNKKQEAFLIICLQLKDNDSDEDREQAQNHFSQLVQQQLTAQDQICPNHIERLLGRVFNETRINDQVRQYGTPECCEFKLELGKKSWFGVVEFQDENCRFTIQSQA